MKKECFIHIKDGKPVEQSRQPIWNMFSGVENGRYRLILERKTHRTGNQNAYMHVLFTLAQRGFYDVGYRQVKTMEDAKELLKRQFLSVTYKNPINGQHLETVRPTSSLTKEDCMVFIDECLAFCAEYLGVNIPSPEEYWADQEKYDSVSMANY